ncbi:MAG: hypothetical protein Athens101426_5 [Parcubacteria group bacterium Athens1014_26]|nr:MAG: hypothetical protein Athens101426_5 [Parcubacteria group bacterium Athens1014_26]
MISVSNVTPECLSKELGGRKYGVHGLVRPAVDISIFESIRKDFKHNYSNLLCLSGNVSKAAIFDAYGKDLKMWEQKKEEFDTFLRDTVRYSMCNETEAEAEGWGRLKFQLPKFSQVSSLFLNAELGAREAAVLIFRLKEESHKVIDNLIGYFISTLKMFLDLQFVGFIERKGVDACRYYYYRHDFVKELIDKTHRVGVRFDENNNKMRRQEILKTYYIHQFVERHIHDVVNAKSYTLENYPMMVPPRIAHFLNRSPVWLRPYLRIADGQITLEQIHRCKIDEFVEIDQINEAWLYSPAVYLGNFSLIGWSGDDLINEGRVFSKIQTTGKWWLYLKKTMYAIKIGIITFIKSSIRLVPFVTFGLMSYFKFDILQICFASFVVLGLEILVLGVYVQNDYDEETCPYPENVLTREGVKRFIRSAYPREAVKKFKSLSN